LARSDDQLFVYGCERCRFVAIIDGGVEFLRENPNKLTQSLGGGGHVYCVNLCVEFLNFRMDTILLLLLLLLHLTVS